METPNIQEKLNQIKKEHSYSHSYSSLRGDTLAYGERLEEILPKLKQLREEIEEYKKILMNERSSIYEEIISFLATKGLPTWEYTGKKMTKTTPKFLNEINLKLSEKYRYNDYGSINEISNMEKNIKASLEYTAKIEREKLAKEQESSRLSAILKTAEKYMTPEELKTAIALGATTEQLEMLIKERYTQSQLGETIRISSCQECDEYTMGENRCSCGNRRISAEAEGYYSNGEYQLYISTEAC
jgi:hypothetical protein